MKVDKVELTLVFPRTSSGTCRFIDFALREICTRPVVDGMADISLGGNVFAAVIELNNDGEPRGAVPLGKAPEAGVLLSAPSGGDGWRSAYGIWSPLPCADWIMSKDVARQRCYDAAMNYTAIADTANGLAISGCDGVLGLEADVEIVFVDGKMRSISAVFMNPPSIKELADAVSAACGKQPSEEYIADAAMKESRVVWKWSPKKGFDLEGVLSEHQGAASMVWRLSEPL